MCEINYETPYYVIDKKELENGLNGLKEALEEYWDNFIIGYSYKTNALPWVIHFFKQKECYAEVVSDDEYLLAKSIGIDSNKIIYNGIIKSKDTFVEAIQNGCIVNIDSRRELDWLDEIPTLYKREIGIRVNFDIEKYCSNHSACGDEGGRFGFCFENGELEKAINVIKEKGFSIVGIHLHTSSKTRALDVYQAIAKVACEIAQCYKLELSYIDIGGGFFGGLSNKPQFKDYLRLVSGILKECFDPKKTQLIVEPGMSLIGAPVSYVTSVIDVKDTTYNRFIVTDGSRTNIDPLMRKKTYFHHYDFCSEDQKKKLKRQVVCGFTCMEHDRLFVAENEVELQVGDKIVYEKVGAYTMCLTPLFIKYFPDVYLDDGKDLLKIRNKWTPENYMQYSIEKEETENEYIDFKRRNKK